MSNYNLNEFQPGFGGKIDSSGNVKNIADVISGTGSTAKLKVDIGSANVSLNASDISIGAVELKDSTTENRLAINSSGYIGVYIMGSVDGGGF